MMLFFTDVHDNLYPVSRIQKIEPSKRDAKTGYRPAAVVVLDRDQSVRVEAYEIDRITACGEPVFAAREGFDHLIFWHHSDSKPGEYHVSQSPVLGWRDTAGAGIVAVTIQDREFIRAPMAVRLPTGAVTDGDSTWPDQASWEAEMLESAELVDHAARPDRFAAFRKDVPA